MISRSLYRAPRAITRTPVFKQTSVSIQRALINYYSSSSPTPRNDTSKAFKAASFSLPKQGETAPAPPQQHESVPQEDIDDFNVTKLVHGTTDLTLAITSRASHKLNSIAEEDKNPHTALKISVESGGCHGFQYNLDLIDLQEELKNDTEGEALVFSRQDGTDNIAQVVLNESSLEILQDSKIDYTKELIGSSFKVVDSPYTSTACGCGASFDFDFDKLQRIKEEREKLNQ